MSKEYKLNSNQLQLLKLMFKFRFCTSDLIARYKNISRSASNYALAILVKRGLVGKNFDSSFKFSGQGAQYYLTTEGVRTLREHGIGSKGLHAIYRNPNATPGFIKLSLNIFAVYLSLREHYPETFNIFTRSELADFDYFPKPSPHLYLNRKNPSNSLANEYMLEINTDTTFFTHKKRLDAFFNHADSGEWEDQGNGYPTLLWVCPDNRIEAKVQKYLENRLDDLEVRTTTIKALLNKHSLETKIWSTEDESEGLVSL